MAVASGQVGMDGRMMTLEEEIKHCEDVANDRAGCCEDCAEQHRQLAEWLKELKAYRQLTEMDKRVTCITCGHLRTEQIQGRKIPDSICAAPIWKELNRTVPHVIGHDTREPIQCDFRKPKGGTEG